MRHTPAKAGNRLGGHRVTSWKLKASLAVDNINKHEPPEENTEQWCAWQSSKENSITAHLQFAQGHVDNPEGYSKIVLVSGNNYIIYLAQYTLNISGFLVFSFYGFKAF